MYHKKEYRFLSRYPSATSLLKFALLTAFLSFFFLEVDLVRRKEFSDRKEFSGDSDCTRNRPVLGSRVAAASYRFENSFNNSSFCLLLITP